MYKIYNQKSIIFIYWMSQTLQECSIFVVLLLLLNLIETGHIQVWALTVTQMAAERLWSHKLCFLQIIFPTLVHTEARAWSCHLTAAAAASQLQLHGSVFALYQLLFLPSWLSSSLPFFLKLEKAQEENGQHQLLMHSFPWLCRVFLVHSHVGWALSHNPGTCSCCCSSGLLRSTSIKQQRSNTGCQAGEKNRKRECCLSEKKYWEGCCDSVAFPA